MAYLTKDEIYEIKRSNDLTLMKKYCDEDKSNDFLHLEYARMLICNGMYSDAKEELKPLSKTKYRVKVVYELGKIALALKDYYLASEHFHFVEDNAEYQFDVEKARYEIGKLELRFNNLSKCKKYFQKLLGTSFDQGARLNLARIYFNQENYEEAKKCLKPLLNTDLDKTIRLELGKVEYALNNVDAARYYFETAIDKKHKGAYYELGKLEYEEGNYKKAEQCFENSKYFDIYLPKTKYLLGKKEEAIEMFKSLLNTNYDVLSRIFLSIIYLKDGKAEETYDIIKDLAKTDSFLNKDINMKIVLVLFKELGVFFYDKYPSFGELSYSQRQIGIYDETDAIAHIINNHTSHVAKNNFSKSIDVFSLFYDVQEMLTEDKKTPTLNLNDMYHIKYPNVGSNGESLIRVITLPGTRDIITMFPVNNNRDEEKTEDENLSYETRCNVLLRKIAKLYELSKLNSFDDNILSDNEKSLLVELLVPKNNLNKIKNLSK